MKPIIGINTNLLAGGPGDHPNLAVRSTYVDAVHTAGGTPILLPSVVDEVTVREHVEICDGFIFIGGPDLSPSRYGATHLSPTISKLPERREEYDFLLIDEVMRHRKPFLAICLGCQEVNVALGGTLIQDIASETDSKVQHSVKLSPHYVRQEVEVEAGTLMAELAGEGRILANSAHHQAIGEPAAGIRISSRCPVDGIVESFELTDYPFGLAVQWHPEVLAKDEEPHLNLFRGLVRASSGARVLS